MKKTGLPIFGRALAAIALSLAAQSAFATSDAWDGSTDGVWATNTNWSTDPATVPGTGDTATFNGAGNSNTTIDLGAGVTINTVLFDTGSAAAYTIGSGAVGSQTLTLNNGGSVTMNATVVNNQLFNSATILGDATTASYTFTNGSTTNTLTFAGNVAGGTGGAAGVKTLNIAGAGNTTISGNLTAGGATAVVVTSTSSGTLTLSGAASSIRTLNINGGAGSNVNLGSGNLTISNGGGSTITTTAGGAISGGTITLTQNDDTNGPDIGTANGTTLTINSKVTGTSSYESWHTANGTGVTVLTGANDYTGATIVNAGVLSVSNIGNTGSTTSNLGQNSLINLSTSASGSQNSTLRYTGTGETTNRVVNFFLNGTNTGGIIEQAGAGLLKFSSNMTATGTGSKTLTLQGSTAGTGEFAGNIVNGSSTVSLVKSGTGTWTLSGANSYTGGTRANAGTLVLSGSNSGNGFLSVNNVGAQNAVLKITAGTQNFFDMPIAEVANSRGAVYQTGGALTLSRAASTDAFAIGRGAGSYGYYKLSAGTAASNEIAVGGNANDSVGVMDITGGAYNGAGWVVLGRGGATSSGVLNVTGTGAVNLTGTVGGSKIGLQWGGSAGAQTVLNISGSGTVTGPATGTSYVLDLALVNTASTLAVTNLGSGGTLQIAGVTASAANPTTLLNFHGGTLKATVANASFISSANIDGVYIYGGGATIHDNGAAVTISRPLLAPTDSGVTTIAVTSGGSGYIGAPLLKITGGTGVGATAVANMVDDGTGNGTFKIDSITVTNPGVYTAAPTTVTGFGGGATTAATLGAISTAANSSGGLTKAGGGTLTLSATNTYSGTTTISGGTLSLASTGSINNSSTINVGASSFYNVSAVAGYTLQSNQTLAGLGTVQGNVALAAGANLSPGTSPGPLTFANNLDISLTGTSNSGDLMFELGGSSDLAVLSSGLLTIGSGVLGFNDFTFTPITGFAPGTYTLFQTSQTISGTLGGTLSGTVGGYAATLSLADSNTDIILTVVPEPNAIFLSLSGCVGFWLIRRRRA